MSLVSKHHIDNYMRRVAQAHRDVFQQLMGTAWKRIRYAARDSWQRPDLWVWEYPVHFARVLRASSRAAAEAA